MRYFFIFILFFNFVYGKFTSEIRYYSGIKVEVVFENKNKIYRAHYYKSGELKTIEYYKDDITLSSYEYYKNGDLRREYIYKGGKRVSYKSYHKNGVLNSESIYKNGYEIFSKSYRENGTLFSETEYKNNLPYFVRHYLKDGISLLYEDKIIYKDYEENDYEIETKYYSNSNSLTSIDNKSELSYKKYPSIRYDYKLLVNVSKLIRDDKILNIHYDTNKTLLTVYSEFLSYKNTNKLLFFTISDKAKAKIFSQLEYKKVANIKSIIKKFPLIKEPKFKYKMAQYISKNTFIIDDKIVKLNSKDYVFKTENFKDGEFHKIGIKIYDKN